MEVPVVSTCPSVEHKNEDFSCIKVSSPAAYLLIFGEASFLRRSSLVRNLFLAVFELETREIDIADSDDFLFMPFKFRFFFSARDW
jgi:hypothetical protein